MKSILTLALTLVLTASLLVGCGCTNRNIDKMTQPTVLPTNEEIWNTTETTRPTTAMTTEPTVETTHETRNPSATDATGDTIATSPAQSSIENRARRMMPDNK
jgi:uncharacterized protein YcfL